MTTVHLLLDQPVYCLFNLILDTGRTTTFLAISTMPSIQEYAGNYAVLTKLIGKNLVGLYGDDGLAIIDSRSGHAINKL